MFIFICIPVGRALTHVCLQTYASVQCTECSGGQGHDEPGAEHPGAGRCALNGGEEQWRTRISSRMRASFGRQRALARPGADHLPGTRVSGVPALLSTVARLLTAPCLVLARPAPGLVPEPARQVEEAQEDHQRVPRAWHAATHARPASVSLRRGRRGRRHG